MKNLIAALLDSNVSNGDLADALAGPDPRVAVDWDNFHETAELLALVHDEIERAERLHGDQILPLRVGAYDAHQASVTALTREAYLNMEAEWKRINDARVEAGCLAWDGIVLEELYEALAEGDEGRAVTELIQTAAMCLKAVKSIQRGGLLGVA